MPFCMLLPWEQLQTLKYLFSILNWIKLLSWAYEQLESNSVTSFCRLSCSTCIWHSTSFFSADENICIIRFLWWDYFSSKVESGNKFIKFRGNKAIVLAKVFQENLNFKLCLKATSSVSLNLGGEKKTGSWKSKLKIMKELGNKLWRVSGGA